MRCIPLFSASDKFFSPSGISVLSELGEGVSESFESTELHEEINRHIQNDRVVRILVIS